MPWTSLSELIIPKRRQQVQPLVNKLFDSPPDYSYFTMLEGKTSLFVKYLFYMWLSAAFGEELSHYFVHPPPNARYRLTTAKKISRFFRIISSSASSVFFCAVITSR